MGFYIHEIISTISIHQSINKSFYQKGASIEVRAIGHSGIYVAHRKKWYYLFFWLIMILFSSCATRVGNSFLGKNEFGKVMISKKRILMTLKMFRDDLSDSLDQGSQLPAA